MTIVNRIGKILSEYCFNHLGIPSFSNERISKKFIKKYLPKNPVSIDCGAHIGADSIEISKIIGGQVYSFEPVPSIFQKLQHNTKQYSNIHCFELALSDQSGKAEFHVSEGDSDASSSLLEPEGHIQFHPGVNFSQVIEVKCKTLDQWAEENRISKVDFLWLDMQGYELHMLKASKTILKNVSVIHSEVSVKNTYKGAPLYEQYRDWLATQGFQMKLECIPQGWDMGNVLFIRS